LSFMPQPAVGVSSILGIGVQYAVQLVRVDGLGEVVIHAGCETTFMIALHDNGNVPPGGRFLCANFPGRLEAAFRSKGTLATD
jgi:hypothetical protein